MEITIFETPEETGEINKTQKELDYEDFKKSSKFAPWHFTNFYEEEISGISKGPSTNILNIVATWLLKYCTPIVLETKIRETTIKNKFQTANEKIKEMNRKEAENINIQKELSDVFSISIQCSNTTEAKTLSGRTIVFSRDDQIHVIGFVVPDKFTNRYSREFVTYLLSMGNEDIAHTGSYTYIDPVTSQYTLQRENLTPLGKCLLYNASDASGVDGKNFNDVDGAAGYQLVQFTTEENARVILNKLMRYADFSIDWYNENYIILNNEFKVKPYSQKYNKLLSWNSKLIKMNNVMRTLLTAIGEPIIDRTYELDIMAFIENKNLSYVYNVGRMLGTDSDIFISMTSALAKEKYDKTLYNNQVTDGFIKKIEINKKQAIALKKYEIDNLLLLDKKQLMVVDLEYARNEKKYNPSAIDRQVQALFNNIRESSVEVTNYSLRKALAECLAVLSDSLHRFELLPGGECPHSYSLGRYTLENFNVENIEAFNAYREKYSLPRERDGYFCKICGGLLSEADNTNVIRFAGDRSNNYIIDELSTMIWKETTYAISTYVKFLQVVPTKPLISSLSNGLRGILGDEEATLIKNKSRSKESLIDTMSLYCSIYIFASLSALIVTNSSAMMFGRFRPTTGAHEKKKNSDSAHNNPFGKSDYVKHSEHDNSFDKSDYVVGDSGGDSGGDNPFGKSDYVVGGDKLHSKSSHSGKPHTRRKTKAEIRAESKEVVKDISKDIDQKDIKLYERTVLTTALNLILITKDSIIKSLPSMTVDIVKQIFLKSAWPWAQRYVRYSKIEYTGIYKNAVDAIKNTDPLYEYLFTVNKLAYSHHKDKRVNYNYTNKHHKDRRVNSSTPHIKFEHSNAHKDTPHIKFPSRSIGAMLHHSEENLLPLLKKGVNAYASAPIPERWTEVNTDVNQQPTNLTVIVDKLGLAGDPVFENYVYDSFIEQSTYVRDNIFTYDIVPMSDMIKSHREKFATLLFVEKKLHLQRALRKIRPTIKIKIKNKKNHGVYSENNMVLSEYFCANGTKHTIGNYVYTNGKSEVELKKSEILSWIKNNIRDKLAEFASMRIINTRCGLCGQLINDPDHLDNAYYTSIFKNVNDVVAFYSYYDTRCPEGELHNIVDMNCIKCKISINIKNAVLSKKDISAADQYYHRYHKKFLAVERACQSFVVNSLALTKKENDKISQYKIKKIDTQYQSTLKYTAELSMLFDIKYNLVLNLGLTEGYKYSDIEEGLVNPFNHIADAQPPLYRTAAIKIKSYALQLLRVYYTFLNHDNVANIPLEIKDIFDAQISANTGDTSVRDFSSIVLISIFPDFSTFIKKDSEHKSLSSELYHNFLLEWISSTLISIASVKTIGYESLSKQIAQYLLQMIITQEKLFAKADYIPVYRITNITEQENEQELISEPTETTNDIDLSPYHTQINMEEAFDVENAADVWETD